MTTPEPLPGNPYTPEYLGDTNGVAAQATLAAAYEIRTAGLVTLYAALENNPLKDRLLDQVARRYGMD